MLRVSFAAVVLVFSQAVRGQKPIPKLLATAPMQATPSSTAPTSQNNNTAKLVEDVKVAGSMHSLCIEIPEPNNLGRVLRAICDQPKLDCTGANTL